MARRQLSPADVCQSGGAAVHVELRAGRPLRYVSILAHLPLYLLPKALLLVPIGWRFVRFGRICASGSSRPRCAYSCWLRWIITSGPSRRYSDCGRCCRWYSQCYSASGHRRRITQGMRVHSGVSLFGELASALVVFPWSGLDAQVGGVATRAAREWVTSDGARRLAGFADSSIDLSLILVIFGVILASKQVRPALRLGLLVVTTAAIYGTTMKTAVAAFVLIAIPIVLPIRPVRIAAAVGGLIAMGLGIALPFALLEGSSRWIGS